MKFGKFLEFSKIKILAFFKLEIFGIFEINKVLVFFSICKTKI